MAVNLSMLAGAGWQFFTDNGAPLSGGKLYTYAAGTTTPAVTYTSVTGLTANTNPIVLDSAGRVPAEIWLTDSLSYKFALKTSTDVDIWTKDNIYGPSSAADLAAFVASLAAPSGSSLVGFIQSQAGAVARTVQSKLRDTVSVFDFMTTAQIADVKARTRLLDVTSAVQSAIDNAGSVYFPPGAYKLTATISISQSYTCIKGDPDLPYFYINPLIGPAFKIIPDGNNLNEFSSIEDIAVWADGMPSYLPPSGTNCAILVNGGGGSSANLVTRAQLKNIRLIGFGTGIFAVQHTNTLFERIFMENHTNWSGVTGFTSANKYIGICFDGTPFSAGGISPNASTEVVNCLFNGSFAPNNVQATGFFMTGPDIRDLFFDMCETVNGNFGWYIESSGTGAPDYNCDIQIRRPIIDLFTQAGIYIFNCTKPGNITINGGYIAPSLSTPSAELACIWIENSTNVAVTGGVQLLGFNNSTITDNGIFLKNSFNCSITGNLVCNCTYGISLQGSSNNTIVGNVVNAEETALESTPLLYDAIRLINTSTYNVVSNNIVNGRSVGYPYVRGINIETNSVSNVIAANNVNENSVTTPYVVGDTRNVITRSTAADAIIQASTIALSSTAGQMVLLGNSATYPFIFKDGGGNTIAGINNLGAFVTAPLP
jgi:parallel beta-helix repeat protein